MSKSLLFRLYVYIRAAMIKVAHVMRCHYRTPDAGLGPLGPDDIVSVEFFGGPADGRVVSVLRKQAWHDVVQCVLGRYVPMKDEHQRPVYNTSGAYMMQWEPYHARAS